jgi:hypothetical protein
MPDRGWYTCDRYVGIGKLLAVESERRRDLLVLIERVGYWGV